MKTLRSHNLLWALVIGLGCLALLAGPALAAKSAEAERYDVELTLNSDGSVQVSETLVFRYSGGPFTFVKREIPTTQTDGLRFTSAGMDGKPLPLGSGAGQVEVSDGSPLSVTWHFAEVSDSSHTFTLNYQALGVAQKQQNADMLVYTPLPREHDYLIRASTVRVRYPAGARLLGQPLETNGRAAVESGSGLVTFRSGALGVDEALEVRLEFAPGSLTQNTPAWQAQALAQEELNQRTQPLYLGGALALLLGGGAALWVLRRRAQPEAAAGLDARIPSGLRPSDLAPALAGALINGGSGSAQTGLLATLFDLARRGVVTIEEQPKQGWLGKKDFLVRLVSLPALKSYEQSLLETLFGAGTLSPGLSTSLQQSGPQLALNWSAIGKSIDAELQQGGWMDAQRQKTAQSWGWAAGVAILVSVLAGAGSLFILDTAGVWVVLPAGALLVLAVAWAVAASSLTHLSDRGLLEAAGWKAFRDYLQQVAKGREPATRPDLFEAYLPYAAAFGLSRPWAGFFQKQGILQIPGWFRSAQGDSGYESLAFISMLDATSSATRGSDSDSSSSGGGDGGSAGGGSSSTG